MAQFPNESAIQTHDVIDLTEQGVFSGFEDELQSTTVGANQSKRDYEFRLAGPRGNIILAKPLKAGSLWACDITSGSPTGGSWVEGAQYDPATGGIDASQSPQAQPQTAPGTCPNCGATGVSGKFCNSCGGPLAFPAMSGLTTQVVQIPGIGGPPGPAQIPVAGPLAPGQMPSAGAGTQPTPYQSNPNRMEGKPKKELVVPESMTRVAKSTGFADALDAMIAEAEAADKQPDV